MGALAAGSGCGGGRGGAVVAVGKIKKLAQGLALENKLVQGLALENKLVQGHALEIRSGKIGTVGNSMQPGAEMM